MEVMSELEELERIVAVKPFQKDEFDSSADLESIEHSKAGREMIAFADNKEPNSSSSGDKVITDNGTAGSLHFVESAVGTPMTVENGDSSSIEPRQPSAEHDTVQKVSVEDRDELGIHISPTKVDPQEAALREEVSDIIQELDLAKQSPNVDVHALEQTADLKSEPLPSSRPVTPDIGTATPDHGEPETEMRVVLGEKELDELAKNMSKKLMPKVRPFKIVLPILSAAQLASARTPPVKKNKEREDTQVRKKAPAEPKKSKPPVKKKSKVAYSSESDLSNEPSTSKHKKVKEKKVKLRKEPTELGSVSSDSDSDDPETMDLLAKLTQKYKGNKNAEQLTKVPTPPPPKPKPERVVVMKESSEDERPPKKKKVRNEVRPSSDDEKDEKPKKKKHKDKEKRHKEKHREKHEKRERKKSEEDVAKEDSTSPKRPRTVKELKMMLAEKPKPTEGVKITEKPSIVEKPDFAALQKKVKEKERQPEKVDAITPPTRKGTNVVKFPTRIPRIREMPLEPPLLEDDVNSCLSRILDEICEPDLFPLKRKYSTEDLSRPVKKRHIPDSDSIAADIAREMKEAQNAAESESEIDDRNVPLKELWLKVPRLMPSDVAEIKATHRLNFKAEQKALKREKKRRELERKSAITEDGRHPKVHPSQKLKKLKLDRESPGATPHISDDSRSSVGRQTPSTPAAGSDHDHDQDEGSRMSAGTPKEKSDSQEAKENEEEPSAKAKMSFVPLPFLKRQESRHKKDQKKEKAEKVPAKEPPKVVPSITASADRKSVEKEQKPKSILKPSSKVEVVKHSVYSTPSSQPPMKRKTNYTSNQAILMNNPPKSWNSANDILKNILDGSTQSMKLLNYKVSKKDEKDKSPDKGKKGEKGPPVATVKPQMSKITAQLRNAQSSSFGGVKIDEDRFASPLERKRQNMTGGDSRFVRQGFYPTVRGARGAPRGRGGGYGSGGPSGYGRGDPFSSARNEYVDRFVNVVKTLSSSSQKDIKEIAEQAAIIVKDSGAQRHFSGPRVGHAYNSGPVLPGDLRSARKPQEYEDDGYGYDDDFGDTGGGDDSPVGEPDQEDVMAQMGLPSSFGGNLLKKGEVEEVDSRRGRAGRGDFRGERGRTVYDQRREDRGRGRGDFRGRGRGDPRFRDRGWNKSWDHDTSEVTDTGESHWDNQGGWGQRANSRGGSGRNDNRGGQDDYNEWGEYRDDRGRGRGAFAERGFGRGKFGGFSRERDQRDDRSSFWPRDRDQSERSSTDRRRSHSRSRSRDKRSKRDRSRSRSRSPYHSRSREKPVEKPAPLDADLDELLKTIVNPSDLDQKVATEDQHTTENTSYISQVLGSKEGTSGEVEVGHSIPPELASEVLNIATNDPSSLLSMIESGGPQIAELLCKIVAAAPAGDQASSSMATSTGTTSSSSFTMPPSQSQQPSDPFNFNDGYLLPPPIFTAPTEPAAPPPPPVPEPTQQPPGPSGPHPEAESAVEHINQLTDLFNSILNNPASAIHRDSDRKDKVASMVPLLVNLRDVANLPGTSDTFDILPDIAQFAMELINEPGMML